MRLRFFLRPFENSAGRIAVFSERRRLNLDRLSPAATMLDTLRIIDEAEGVAALNEPRAGIEALEAEGAEPAARAARHARKETRLTEARSPLLSLKTGLNTSDPHKQRRIIEALAREAKVLHTKSRETPRVEIRWRSD